MDAGVVAADVAQRPGDVGVACLPVRVAVELGHLAHLLVEQRGDGGIEDGIIGDDLPGGVLAGLGRTVDRLVDRLAKCGEFLVQLIDGAAHGGAIVERTGQVFADCVHPVARAVGLLAIFVVELRPHPRIHDGRPVQDVGGETALGIEVARNFADGPDHFKPALGDGNLVHRLVFRNGHVNSEPAADDGQGDDGGSQQGTDFHGIWADQMERRNALQY